MACRPLKNCNYRTEKVEREMDSTYCTQWNECMKRKEGGKRRGELNKRNGMREWKWRYGEVKMSERNKLRCTEG